MSRWRLCWSPTSPFVRKVTILAHETGLFPEIELLPKNVWAADTDIGEVNPLGKVPALILEDGTVVFDSPVILDYLDGQHGGQRMLPEHGPARLRALTVQALADGVLDALVLRLLESRRPEALRSADWTARQMRAVGRGLDQLEREAEVFGEGLDVGKIAAIALLGYLDFRFPADDWRLGRPGLAAWFDRESRRPSFLATLPKDPV